MSEKEKLLEILKNNVNLKGIAVGLIVELLEPALEKVVADTANPIDDMVKAALYPPLKVKLVELINEKVDDLFK